jgi:hypothetical protein
LDEEKSAHEETERVMTKIVGLVLALVLGALALLAMFVPARYSEPNSPGHDSHFCPVAPFYDSKSFIDDLTPDSLSHDSAEIAAAECSRKLDGRVRIAVSATAIGFIAFVLYAWAALRELTLRTSYLDRTQADLKRSLRQQGQRGNPKDDQ